MNKRIGIIEAAVNESLSSGSVIVITNNGSIYSGKATAGKCHPDILLIKDEGNIIHVLHDKEIHCVIQSVNN